MSPALTGRFKSLDILRGVSIAAMIVVNSSREDAYPHLLHSTWNGWTFADTIFPCFLWIVGVALTLSTAGRVARGEARRSLLIHAVRRSALLFGCGLFLEMFVFPSRAFPYFAFIDHFRFSGVLQKIAVCYLVAFLIFLWTTWRGRVLTVISLNLIYLSLLFFYPVPECGAGVLTVQCNFPGYIDSILLKGNLWNNGGMQDPDGLGSILPAISTVLLGVLAGDVLRKDDASGRRVLRLIGMGCGLVAAASVLAVWIPINKILWTTSYAVLMAGLAALCFAVTYWVVDVQGWRQWGKPLEILGLNAVAAYMVSRLGANVPKVHFLGKSLYNDLCLRIADPANASLLFSAANVAGVYVVIWWMYHRRWFLKF
ncbi:MAG: acyltransferase family protein [Bryobacteraceae bacterium]